MSVFPTTAQESGPTTLDEYVGRMKAGQERIYYATGDSLAAAANSPHLEAFKAKGYEVLLLADPVDQVWVDTVPEFKGKRFQSVGRGDAGIGTFEERKEAEKELKERAGELKPLLEALAKALGDSVKEVRVSGRLTESPACLVADANAPSPQLEAMLRAMGQEVPAMPRILEVNPGNPVVERLRSDRRGEFRRPAPCRGRRTAPRAGGAGGGRPVARSGGVQQTPCATHGEGAIGIVQRVLRPPRTTSTGAATCNTQASDAPG